MSEKNVHQLKKDLISEINFLWHSPKLSESERLHALELLTEIRDALKQQALSSLQEG